MHGLVNPSGLLQALWNIQRGECFHCGKPMHFVIAANLPKNQMATRDHIFPRCVRGKGLLNNIVLAHAKCNHDRGAPQFPTDDEIARTKEIYSKIGLTAFVPSKDTIGASAQALLIAKKFNGPNSEWFKSKPTIKDIWPIKPNATVETP